VSFTRSVKSDCVFLDINKSIGPAAMQPYLKVIEQLILETISVKK